MTKTIEELKNEMDAADAVIITKQIVDESSW